MITLRQISINDSEIITNAFKAQGWDKNKQQFEDYVKLNKEGRVHTVLAFFDKEFAGYGNIFWESHYVEFKKNNVPEIVDLNTLIKFRQNKVATAIMDKLEEIIFKEHQTVGIGVGLIKDYGPAQRMYGKRGYIPNAKGIYYSDQNLGYFDDLKADDDLVMYLTKTKADI